MSRYIDADKLCEGRVSNDPVVIAVSCEPTADVKPVVRGEWVKENMGYDCYCSICNNYTGCEFEYVTGRGKWDYQFCGHCGADMRGEENDL